MGHSSINLQGGVSGFAQSLQNMKAKGMDSGVKIHATPIKINGQVQKDSAGNIKYHTYSSNNSKGIWPGSSKKREQKVKNAQAQLTKFVQDMANQHQLSKDDRISAQVLVADVFINPDNAAQSLQKLSNLLEDASGSAAWKTKMRANESKKQVDHEFREISQGIATGQKGLLNPKSDFAKSMKQNVLPVASQPAASKGIRTVNLDEELGGR